MAVEASRPSPRRRLRTRRRGRSPLSGVARTAGSRLVRALLPRPARDHGRLQRLAARGVHRRRLRLLLENFRYLWDPLYGEVFLRTFGLAVFGTVATLVVGFPFAYYLARYAQHKTLLLLLVIIPFWTSFLIRTYSWLIILGPDFPLFRWLRDAGITSDDFSLLYTREAIYIGVVYNYLPLMILPLYAALERMDWSLVDAAMDLGDRPLRAFRRVTLPLVLPGSSWARCSCSSR